MNSTSTLCVLSLVVGGSDKYPVRHLQANRNKYCKRIGARCIFLESVPSEPGVGLPWHKVSATLEHSSVCARILWVDADAIIVNAAPSFTSRLDHHDVAISRDENGLNTGIVAWRLPAALPLLRRVWERRRRVYHQHPAWQEQNAVLELLPSSGLRINVVPPLQWNWKMELRTAQFVFHIAGCYCCAPPSHCASRLRDALLTLAKDPAVTAPRLHRARTPRLAHQGQSHRALEWQQLLHRKAHGAGTDMSSTHSHERRPSSQRVRAHHGETGAATELTADGSQKAVRAYDEQASREVRQATTDPSSMFDMSMP